MKKQQLYTLISIGIILIGGVVLVWQKRANQELSQKQNQKQEQEQSKRPNKEHQEVDISDWKTYRNEEFGFEARYPKDWEVDIQSHRGGLLPFYDVLLKKDILGDKKYSMEFSFGPHESKAGGYVTGIYIESKANGSIDDIVKRDFAWENREQVFIHGWRAELLCWKSGCKHEETGIDKRFILEKDGLIWQIFGGVSIEKGTKERVIEIENFFSSFRFLD